MYEAIELAIKKVQAAQELIATDLDIPAIEALILVMEGLNHQSDASFDELSADHRRFVRQALKESAFASLSLEQKRQVLQLLLVATMQEDKLQGNYQVTPDAIGMWVTFFVEKFLASKEQHQLLDLTLGSGNLLATVNLALNQRGDTAKYVGVENDDTMITVASGMAALLDLDWQLIHQDAVLPLTETTNEMDVVIADLPVGYYPQTDMPTYETKATEGLTFVHHLLIEQAVKQLRPNGLGLLLVPANLFDSEQATSLLKYFQSESILFQGFIQFSDKLFLEKQASKALLIVQRPGDEAQQAEPVMLAKAPDLSQKESNLDFVRQMTAWMQSNHMVH